MSAVGEREAYTKRRVVAFLRDALGYVRLGDALATPTSRQRIERIRAGARGVA